MATTFDVKTQGVDQLLNRLMGFEKDVYKALQTDIKSAADLIGASARGLLPGDALRNWGPWEFGRLDYYGPSVASTIKSSFRTRQIGGQRYVMGAVKSTSAAGAVYGLAGSQTTSGTFNQYLNSKWGVPVRSNAPRAMGPAWHMHVDEAREGIQDAVNRAAAKVG